MEKTSFEKKIQLPYPECDIRNRIKLSNVMRHIQEVSGEHLEALGLHHTLLWEEGFVYLLTRVELHIARLPSALEEMRVVTWPRPCKGAQSMRDVSFYDAAGRELIAARTAWVLADPHTHRLHRPSELPHEIPIGPAPEGYRPPVQDRVRRPEGLEPAGWREVRYSDIDCNLHMNNAVYSDIVCDFLPFDLLQGREIAEYRIHFIKEAALGDRLAVYCAPLPSVENTWYAGADRPDGSACFEAVIRFQN